MSYGYSTRVVELNASLEHTEAWEGPGVRLGALCIKHNVPVSLVAEDLGVSRQTIYNWFCGTTSPNKDLLPEVERLVHNYSRRK